jgi:hypothetical protein
VKKFEKKKLLALLDCDQRWCRGAEARDENGDAVRYNDATASAWDLTGALCHLFGWERACELFRQVDRHIHGRQKTFESSSTPDMRSMAAIQDYNDNSETTYPIVVQLIQSMPVWDNRSALDEHEIRLGDDS